MSPLIITTGHWHLVLQSVESGNFRSMIHDQCQWLTTDFYWLAKWLSSAVRQPIGAGMRLSSGLIRACAFRRTKAPAQAIVRSNPAIHDLDPWEPLSWDSLNSCSRALFPGSRLAACFQPLATGHFASGGAWDGWHVWCRKPARKVRNVWPSGCRWGQLRPLWAAVWKPRWGPLWLTMDYDLWLWLWFYDSMTWYDLWFD